MRVVHSPRFAQDLVDFLSDRETPDVDLSHLQKMIDQLQSFPQLGEQCGPGRRRRYLARLRAHLYYRYNPGSNCIDLLALWPAYRQSPFS